MNDGFLNEQTLINYINNHTYATYNDNIKAFLLFAFGKNLNPNLPFVASKPKGQVKPDVLIEHNNTKKYISIKKGSGNSVHQESIDVFFPYANSLIGNNSLNHLKKFHYGDDTIDDTGNIRYSASDCKKRYKTEIELLNYELNKTNNLLKFLDRFLFVGNVSDKSVDVIYHGTLESGI